MKVGPWYFFLLYHIFKTNRQLFIFTPDTEIPCASNMYFSLKLRDLLSIFKLFAAIQPNSGIASCFKLCLKEFHDISKINTTTATPNSIKHAINPIQRWSKVRTCGPMSSKTFILPGRTFMFNLSIYPLASS